MIIPIFITLCLFGWPASCEPWNAFEVLSGCKQYNADSGYYRAHPYFPISQFRNLNVTGAGIKRFRMGTLGYYDGQHLRFAPKLFPYDYTEMTEVVLSGWANVKTVARRYTRVSPSNTVNETWLREQSSEGMLKYYKPFMFTVAVHPNGMVQLTKDKDSFPFLEYRYQNVVANYVGFCNWEVPLVFFYDCPLV